MINGCMVKRSVIELGMAFYDSSVTSNLFVGNRNVKTNIFNNDLNKMTGQAKSF